MKDYFYYQLTVDQGGRMCSSASTKKDRNSIIAKDFKKLVQLELVEKREYFPDGSKKKRVYYSLTNDGIAVCMVILKKSDRRRYKKTLEKLTIAENTRHQEAVIDVVASFNDKRNMEKGSLELWINDRDVEYQFAYLSSKYHMIKPDGYGIWIPNLGRDYFPFLLEVQRTVGDYEEICEKVKKYWYLFESGEYEKLQGHRIIPPILYVVSNTRVGVVVEKQIHRAIRRSGTTLDYAAKWLVFAVALLSDIRDPDKGPFKRIWIPILHPMDQVSFLELFWFVRQPPQLPLHANDERIGLTDG